jgi:hypothetical protein
MDRRLTPVNVPSPGLVFREYGGAMTEADPKTAGRVPTTGHIPTDVEIRQLDDWLDQTIAALKMAALSTPAYPGLEALDTAVSILVGQMRDCRERVDIVGMAVAWGDLTRTARQMRDMPGFQDAWLDRPDGTL